jgi:hemerythrin-like domain-containing protein
MAKQNILSLIKQQHDLLRKSIRVLRDDDLDQNQKQSHFRHFFDLLKRHTEGEERTLYEVLRGIPASEMAALEAIEFHKIAADLMEELDELSVHGEWNQEIAAKTKVLAEWVEHHLEDEERDMFRRARNHLLRIELDALGVEFARVCEEYERDQTRTVSDPQLEKERLLGLL